MALVVRRQLFTKEVHVQSQISPYGICSGESGTGVDFPPSASVFPFNYRSTSATYEGISNSFQTESITK
jgi:hypothetical protein